MHLVFLKLVDFSPYLTYHFSWISLSLLPCPFQNLKFEPAVDGAVPVSARVCDFDPRKTCLAELGRARKEGTCRGVGKSRKLEVQL